jgi:hypothetical protein
MPPELPFRDLPLPTEGGVRPDHNPLHAEYLFVAAQAPADNAMTPRERISAARTWVASAAGAGDAAFLYQLSCTPSGECDDVISFLCPRRLEQALRALRDLSQREQVAPRPIRMSVAACHGGGAQGFAGSREQTFFDLRLPERDHARRVSPFSLFETPNLDPPSPSREIVQALQARVLSLAPQAERSAFQSALNGVDARRPALSLADRANILARACVLMTPPSPFGQDSRPLTTQANTRLALQMLRNIADPPHGGTGPGRDAAENPRRFAEYVTQLATTGQTGEYRRLAPQAIQQIRDAQTPAAALASLLGGNATRFVLPNSLTIDLENIDAQSFRFPEYLGEGARTTLRGLARDYSLRAVTIDHHRDHDQISVTFAQPRTENDVTVARTVTCNVHQTNGAVSLRDIRGITALGVRVSRLDIGPGGSPVTATALLPIQVDGLNTTLFNAIVDGVLNRINERRE